MSYIDFDIKLIVDFLMQNDLVDCMVHICSLLDDYLTPYLRIITVLQIK
jgi:hypothetical protein